MFGKIWGIYLFVGVVIEGVALMRGAKGDTFSEFVWGFLDGGPARWVLVTGFLIWAIAHFLGKGRYG